MTIPDPLPRRDDPLSDKEIEDRLAELPGWRLTEDGCGLTRRYGLPHLAAAILALHIARIQDETGHYGELTIGRDRLDVTIATHGGERPPAEQDFELARRIHGAAQAHRAR